MGGNKRSSEGKHRKAIANSQRRALRAWYFDQSDGPKTQADASVWWQQAYGYHLNSSTVSEILSYKYDFLEAEPCNEARKRDRPAKWEELDEELITWVLWYESFAGEGSVTSSMLRQRGTELWYSMPCYQGLPVPKWSEGWRNCFMARYNLRRYKMLKEGSEGSTGFSDMYTSGESCSSESTYGEFLMPFDAAWE